MTSKNEENFYNITNYSKMMIELEKYDNIIVMSPYNNYLTKDMDKINSEIVKSLANKTNYVIISDGSRGINANLCNKCIDNNIPYILVLPNIFSRTSEMIRKKAMLTYIVSDSKEMTKEEMKRSDVLRIELLYKLSNEFHIVYNGINKRAMAIKVYQGALDTKTNMINWIHVLDRE